LGTLLDTIHTPQDVRALTAGQLTHLAEEIRERIIAVVSKNGGHLSSNLGVTELTIALHYCFDFTRDRLLWDVGHQCYPHKLLTGRHGSFATLRTRSGVSGFPDIHESPFDLFSVGHAGTSIATAVGMARGDQLLERDTRVVALVGDASIFNGVAFEGLNQAGLLKRQLLVILNDNEWGIAPTQGGMANYLAKFRTSGMYEEVKEKAKRFLPRVPVVGKSVYDALDHLKEGIKATVSPHQIFEQLGFVYVGPTDGHDLPHLIEMLDGFKDVQHPVLLHVHTDKGRGCAWACAEPGRFHSPKPFRVSSDGVTIESGSESGSGKSWTEAFADALIERARRDDRLVALTAAMPDGTGLNRFAEVFPDRCLDVGIAESATVDIAAGMCKTGLKPVVAVYSTFLQRAFDQVFQEVALQELPVTFCIDRAGLVGGDGAVHHGFLDVTYLRGLPGMVLMAPADEPEIDQALQFALTLDRPCAIRYARDKVPEPFGDAPPFVLGQSRMMRRGNDAVVLAYGSSVSQAIEAADSLAAEDLFVSVVNARFAQPLDETMVRDAFATGVPVVTVEDHSIVGGFGSAVLEKAQELGLDTRPMIRLGMPADRFIPHGSRAGQLAEAGIDADAIARTLRNALADDEADDNRSTAGPPSTMQSLT